MLVSKQEILKVALLARLRFSSEELESFTQEFARILGYLDTLEPLNLSEVSPTRYASLGHKTIELREDFLQTSLLADEIGAQAPDFIESCFNVPKMIS